MKVIPQTFNKHKIIQFQAWADSHVNFPYHVRAPFHKNMKHVNCSFSRKKQNIPVFSSQMKHARHKIDVTESLVE